MTPPHDSAPAFEQRFDRARQRIGLAVAPAIFALLIIIPTPGLKPEAHQLLAIVGLTVALWISEAIPIPAAGLLGPTLCVLLGVAGARDVFRSFADPVIFLFLGSFLLSEAMLRHGLNRRIALAVLGVKWVGNNPQRLLWAFGLVTAFISMWVSNTATTAMMFPIALSILSEVGATRSDSAASGTTFGARLMLVTAFAASAGGIATPVGTPPNLIGLARIESSLGLRISFFQWMSFGVPLALVLVAVTAWLLGPRDLRQWQFPAGAVRQRGTGPTAGERNVLIAFVFTVSLWLLPGIVGIVVGTAHPTYDWLTRHFPESTIALAGALLLFLLPVNWKAGEFTLTWKDAENVDWGTIILFGGGLALGDLMFTTGLATWIGESVVAASPLKTELGLVIVFTVVAIIVSETTSNTASAAMIVPAAIAVAKAAGISPLQPALAACLGSSMGFMLPVSTPPNAIVYGSGMVPLRTMLRYGVVLDIVGAVLIVCVAHWLVPLIVRAK